MKVLVQRLALYTRSSRSPLAAPSVRKTSPKPPRERSVIIVTFFPRLRRIVPLALFPLGARAYRRIKARFDPVSSINRHLFTSRSFALLLHSRRSSSFLSLASNVFFFRVHRKRRIARLIVEILTLTPVSASHSLQCSSKVASGWASS